MENKNLKLNKTSLYDHHILLNAKMVNFASYLMPINYDRGIKYEYDSVRNDVGIFDVSHMGVFKISGKKSESFLNNLALFQNTQHLSYKTSNSIVRTIIIHAINKT